MTRTLRGIVAWVLAATLAAGVPALPASAATTVVGTFAGTASVGKWFRTACDKDGVGIPTGRGLYHAGTVTIPGVSNGDDTREETGVWQLSTTGFLSTGQTQSGLMTGPFVLNVCGHLSQIVDIGPSRFDGLGASCESSKGHHGQGNVLFSNGERIKLYDLGWKASAGGAMPMLGAYQEYADDWDDPQEAAKKDKLGSVLGLANWQGGGPCLGLKTASFNNGNGAQAFSIFGELQLLNGPTPPSKDEPKQCKDLGPEASNNGSKKSHDNKPGFHQCTSKDGGSKGAPTPTPTPTPNRSPGTPTQINPPFGHTFVGSDPQVFTLRATDPEGDSYHGVVEVSALGGAVVSTFTTASAASGADSSGTPSSALSSGTYSWRVKACDTGSAACGPFSAASLFRVTSGGNQPPAVPTLVSPPEGHPFASGAPQTFTVRAADPEGDLYRGEVVVENLSGAQAASFSTAFATSDANSSGGPSPALPAGTYSWRARSCDPLGSGGCSVWSAARGFTVAGVTWLSATCDQSTVVDGWVSDVFLRVSTKSPLPRTSWVCLRGDYQSSFNRGGRLEVSHSDPAAVLQTSTAAACEPFAGTPLLNGEVGDSADPATWFTYRAVLKQTPSAQTVCVRMTRAGGTLIDHAVLIDAPDGGDVTATFQPDPIGVYPALEDSPPDVTRPSADCQLAGTGKTRILNAEIAGVPAWLYGQQSGGATKLCVRVGHPGGAGGRFTITGGSPGAEPILVQPGTAEPDAPDSPCGVNVWSNTDPAAVKVRRSATGANPVAICLGIEGTNLRALVNLAPGGTPPTVTWTPDSA